MLELRVRNFKGIREFTLQARGANVAIYGDNATGKTTLADAWSWLTSDKDSAGRKEFEIKTLDAGGDPIHNLQHEVEGLLDLGGRTMSLRKVYAEQWTKKRGSPKAEFSGHTTEYFVDGVPCNRTEYAARIAQIAPEAGWRLLSDPAQFSERLKWEERRRILLEVCGDVSDADVIASDPELAELPTILGQRSLEDHRKVLASQKTELNKQLGAFPVRIDEATRALPDAGDAGAVQSALVQLRQQREAKAAEKARMENGGQVAELRRRLSETQTAILEIERGAQVAADENVRRDRTRLNGVTDQADDKRREIRQLQAQLTVDEAALPRLQGDMDRLRAEWTELNTQELQHASDETCPACGQPLPVEEVQAAHDRALADFNARKAQKLETISTEGKRLKAQAEDIQRLSAERRKRVTQAEQALTALDAQVHEIRAQIERAMSEAPNVSQNPEYRRLSQLVDELTVQIESAQAGGMGALEPVTQAIRTLDEQITAAEATVTRIQQRAQGLARIGELRAQERKLTAAFEELERQVYLTDQFVRTKVGLLTDRINSHFSMAQFKLFDIQVNGATPECCDTTYQGVPYADLNNGARINAGLDIINTLSEHYGVEIPVFVDNAESVTRLIPTRAQLVSLVVSATDKSLRVEIGVPATTQEAV